LAAKPITNGRQEQEKFNKILGFARTIAADSRPWLIKLQSDVIKIYPFLIKRSNNHWLLERHQEVVGCFSTRSAALAYCTFYKKQQYYLAERTAELDKKLEILAAEIVDRKASIKQARTRSQHWRADLQEARYLENLSEYQRVRQELKKNISQGKILWPSRTPPLCTKS
jgi:hypothetical protein